MIVEILLEWERLQAYAEPAVTGCQAAVAAGVAARGVIDRDELRRAMRTLLVAFRVYR